MPENGDLPGTNGKRLGGGGKGMRKPRRTAAGHRSNMREVQGEDGNVTHLNDLLGALHAAKDGDFEVRLPFTLGSSVIAQIARVFNDVIARNQALTDEIVRIERVVGREGRMVERATLPDATGSWLTNLNSINALIGDMVQPTTEVARVLSAVADGDLSQKITVDVKGTLELQSQSRELTLQQEELKKSNAALEQQALELEEKAKQLEEQNTSIEVKNREVELARASLEEKAEQLSLISRYKSEFLANMSHELRTPLNSLLILAKLLSDNQEANLTDKQIEYAKTIYASGGDLLSLIDEILDLSKVESGKMQIEVRDVVLVDLKAFVDRSFRPVAEQKGLEFSVELAEALPARMRTDPQRLHQVLKNLLANAFKFTERGGVRLSISVAVPSESFENETLRRSARAIAFSVADTGIGIPRDKHRIIFEAFQQADGTTSRKYGATGLGLSISREIARLLGGEIHVASNPGEGSTFTLLLPERFEPRAAEEEPQAAPAVPEPTPRGGEPGRDSVARGEETSVGTLAPDPQFQSALLPNVVDDDREHLREGDKVLLIIEDDTKFAKIMVGLARERGFKAVLAVRGDTGLSLANELLPAAITLDIQLPVVDGWSLLDRLKRNPRTRHIPVHVISVVEKSARSVSLGAFAYLEKPVSQQALEGALSHISGFIEKTVRRLLLVEDHEVQARSIVELVGSGGDVEVTTVRTVAEALRAVDEGNFDCVILDLILGADDGSKLLEQVKTQPRFHDLPVIVYTGGELTKKEELRLKKYAESVILKSSVSSAERLLQDSSLFLHRVVKDLPDSQRAEMDGYETMRAIREHPRFKSLPIIAITTKALKEDRERCIDAGASDYLPKPVEVDRLLDLIRLWTRR